MPFTVEDGFDRNLEGVLSLGAALGVGGFVWSGRGSCRMSGSLLGPRLRGTAALQVNNGRQSFDLAPERL